LGKNKKIIWRNLSDSFKEYIMERECWIKEIIDFRHPLVHRIPLYAPATVSEKKIGTNTMSWY
jgi:hypothetical protein